MADPAHDSKLLDLYERKETMLHLCKHVPNEREYMPLALAYGESVNRLQREIENMIGGTPGAFR